MSRVSRRNFMKKGAQTLVVAGIGSMTLREVVAAAAAQGRRPLTSAEFNRRLVQFRGTALRQEVTEAKADLAGFLSKRFFLTSQQLQNLKGLPPADIRALNQALDRAAAENLTIKLAASTDQGGCQRLRPVFTPGTLTIETGPANAQFQ